jgi:hypothetical protein
MFAAARFALVLLATAGCASAPPRTESPISSAAPAQVTPALALAPAAAPAAPAAAPTPPAPTGPQTTPPGNMSGGKEHAMSNCPSAVPGARTSMVFTDDGIALSISATTAEAQKEIRRRAHLHASMSAPSGRGLHSGGHGGPGRIGYCPIIHDGRTVVTAIDTRTGAMVRMRADGNDDAVAELQELVALRVSGLPPVMPPDLPMNATNR